MPIGGRLTEEQKRKAAKTPVHGAAAKAKKALGLGGKKKQMKPGKTPSSQADRQKLYENQTTRQDRAKAAKKAATASAKAQGFRRTKTGGYVKIGGAEDERRHRMAAQKAREKGGEKQLTAPPKKRKKPRKGGARRGGIR